MEKTMINLLIERFNCGRIWALVILSVLRTNDLTWLAFFRYKCNYIASIESIEFRLELKLTRRVAVMSLYSSMWGLNQACRCLWKARFCSSLNSFQHNMLKLLTVSQCLLWHRLFNWKADWFHLVHHAVLLQDSLNCVVKYWCLFWVWVIELYVKQLKHNGNFKMQLH